MNGKSASDWDDLPRVRQHRATVSMDDGCYIVEFENGPVTQGYGKEDAMHMAEDALATFTDRHLANFNAKFIQDDLLIVWELIFKEPTR